MYENRTAPDAVRGLKTDALRGLSESEATKRRSEYGPNRLRDQEQKTIASRIMEQLNDPLILILMVAMAISMMLHEFGDAVIIVAVVALNAVVGIIQEGKAGRAVEALKQLSQPRTQVLRDGMQIQLPAEELVPGDIVLLEAGNRVPADLRLIESIGIFAEESTLTGESVPVEKDASCVEEKEAAENSSQNMVYMSTYVTRGRGRGVVTATGMDTRVGHIADMLHGHREKLTPLQVRLGELGKMLSALAVGICVLLFVVALLQKRDVGEMLLTSVSLAVAAVPEGLPAIVTIVLALSVSRMVKAKTIVRRLSAVETLGAVEVVCSDKTGTLTQNKMTVTACYLDGRLLEGAAFEAIFREALDTDGVDSCAGRFLRGCVLCNDGKTEGESDIGDPTELAMLHMALSCGALVSQIREQYPRVDERGFDAGRKMMTTLHWEKEGRIAYTKGAAERILESCNRFCRDRQILPLTGLERDRLFKVQQRLMEDGGRVLALAMEPGGSMRERELVFLGFVSMQDPIRPEAPSAVQGFRRAGVSTVMITGDHPDTAFSIARELGIARYREECLTGRELDRLREQSFLQKLPQIRVFARVTPEHKVRIVEGYRSLHKTVAMTGDGVNDAPSLQAADIGIAMGEGGTDVARGAADFVLMDDNVATIHTAIREGRGIYENIRKSVLFLLSSNLGEILTMLLTIIAGLPSPLKAGFILWINLITDSLPALALGVDENDTESLMREPPRRREESLFAKGGLLCVICYGLVIGTISLAAFLKVPYDRILVEGVSLSLHNILEGLKISTVLARAQTHAFTVLGISQLFHAVGMRDVNRSVFRMDHKSNPQMLLALAVGILLQAAVTEIPFLIELFGTVRLSMEEWVRLGALSVTPLIVHELLVLSGMAGCLARQGSRECANGQG